ncbi:Acetyltransferase involved in cellulose biosynthesis, CelD/BcsL family [Roseibium suaedae]|uniref:Acetyltransferase involved in cellulose biosynthesis, CelD/BcsL family n=2 Tax=Roseibium suaedae TaxID=735517 RepID=A0A1M7AEQ9_9HYPH|nr:Acetyltransferase involved in cellulose biosynthesis, CelD/BcsL family [Roseibium suaedae]
MQATQPDLAYSFPDEPSQARSGESDCFEIKVHAAPAREEMEQLWARLPGGSASTPFQTIGFFEAFQRNMLTSSSDRFEIHEIRQAETGETVMLVPLHRSRRGPLRIASIPDLGLADQSGPIISNNLHLSTTQAQVIWLQLTKSLTNVDLIMIRNIVPKLGSHLSPLYQLACARDEATMLMLALAPEGEQEFWRTRPVFKEIRQKNRKLDAQGVRLVEVRAVEDRLEIIEMIREQRRIRFEAMGRPNSLEFPGRVGFYKDIASLRSYDSNAVFLALRTDTEIAAAVMTFINQDMLNGVLIAIGDEKWHRMSPGVVLFARTMDWAKANGIRQFSFGTGMQDYKQRFGPQEVLLKRIQLPLTRIGKCALKLHRVKQTLRNYLRKENGG